MTKSYHNGVQVQEPWQTQNLQLFPWCIHQSQVKQACSDRFPPFPTRKSVFRSLKLRWLRLHHHHIPTYLLTYIPYMKNCTSAQPQNLTQARTVNFKRCFWSVWHCLLLCVLTGTYMQWWTKACRQALPPCPSCLQPACNQGLSTEALECSNHQNFSLSGFWIGKTLAVSHLQEDVLHFSVRGHFWA
jgi:hypothetical protein